MLKRGQVTLFIILGIVLVVALSMIFIFKSEITEFFGSLNQQQVVIPEQLKPVQNYLDDCVERIGLDGVNLLASQGGYINIPEDKIKRGIYNKFSNSLEVLSGYEVAYWFYEDRNYEQVSQVPSLENMENQLEDYVLNTFDECIAGLDYYKQLGYDIKFSKGGKASVDIGDENVNVKVSRRVNVEYKEVGKSWAIHTSDIEVPLGYLYEKAVDLINQENKNLWLENATMNYIILYDLPYDDVEFTCSAKIWDKNELENKFKQYLTFNVPFYKIKGSNFDSYYYNEPLFVWNTGKNFKDINVIFEYNEEWPIDFEVEPSQGDSVISRPIPGGLSFVQLCVNYENFFYTVKHPLLISLSKDDFEFSFADMVVVRRNKAREQMQEEVVNRIDYCESRYNEVAVNILSYENGSLSPLHNADVFYNCVAFNCFIGKTDETGRLKEKFPLCGNGVLEVKKEGYVDKFATINTFENGDEQASLWLEPIINLDYEIKVKDKIGNSLGEARNLADDETVLLEVSKLESDNVVYGHVGIYPEQENKIGLTADLYHVKASLVKNSEVIIPKETIERCKCPEVLGVCLCGTESYTIPENKLDNVVLGGADFDWLIDRNDLTKTKITFYVINNGVPNNFETLKDNFDLEEIGKGVYEQLKPEFR